jgi:hypothetical protein
MREGLGSRRSSRHDQSTLQAASRSVNAQERAFPSKGTILYAYIYFYGIGVLLSVWHVTLSHEQMLISLLTESKAHVEQEYGRRRTSPPDSARADLV